MISAVAYQNGAKIVDEYGKKHNKNVFWLAPCIKNDAGKEQHSIVKPFSQKPIQ